MGYLVRGSTAGGKTYDLLPCPHCGGEAEFRDGSSTAPYIRCKSCGCRTGSGRSYEKLVERWNRRSERTCRMGAPIDGEYQCGECGHLNRETYRADKGWYPPEYCAHCGARVVEGDA